MPKQIWKIDQFHGGLSSNSDPRDISPQELSGATDMMVDQLGMIRTIGGVTPHSEISESTNIITPGYGLFQQSHDRVYGTGSDENVAETGDDFIIFSSPGEGLIYLWSRDDGNWHLIINRFIDNFTGGNRKDVFYKADGAIRVSDAQFKNQNIPVWRGYINRKWFDELGAGSGGGTISSWKHQQAFPKATAISSFSGWDLPQGGYPWTDENTDNPIAVVIDSEPTDKQIILEAADNINKNTDSIVIQAFLNHSGGHSITLGGSPTFPNANLTPGLANFCAIGDKILLEEQRPLHGDGVQDFAPVSTSYLEGEGSKIFTVAAVSSNSTNPNTIDFEEELLNTDGFEEHAYTFSLHNLSRSAWFDPVNTGWQLAVSTLYDDSKQESALAVAGGRDNPTTLQPKDFLDMKEFFNASGNIARETFHHDGYAKFKINFLCFADLGEWLKLSMGHEDSDGLSWDMSHRQPRCSGFKIYMRRENTSTWYLQSEIDITLGTRWFQRGSYIPWRHEDSGGLGPGYTNTGPGTGRDTHLINKMIYRGSNSAYGDRLGLRMACPIAVGTYLDSPREIETYESETGYDSSTLSVGFDDVDTGFKTAVVANRIAYIGHPRIRNKSGVIETHGDAVLKSAVGKFDSFTIERRLETEIRDGDEIIKLEEYADRLLIFKKKKMHLLNISQEVEFLEDTFAHKGISHPTATCKTDFGIAWVNIFGCYLYDGKTVTNLLEKQGRQILKESDWATFAADEPMIGYIPKKRQLIVLESITSTGNDTMFLYDIVTQSWVKGEHNSTERNFNNDKTNFVIDWNGDLIWAYLDTSGNAKFVKWDDASTDTTSFSLKTKDIDFGQPAQRKKVYNVRLSYKGDGSSLIVKYSVNGDTDTLKQFKNVVTGAGDDTPLVDFSDNTKWQTAFAALVPTTSSEANNIHSFQLHMDGTVDANFEINDISIVYRLKTVK